MEELIKDVSDTARWIAMYRAQETARPDAVFQDVLARKLAGEKGAQIAATVAHTDLMAFAMVARTTAIDRLVLSALALGIDTVINLGAGLDTRPYRMKLPKDLRWIEVDFAHMIEYKNQMLASDEPVCRLERIACDLTKEAEREKIFQQLGSATKSALIITEGVIGYLTNTQAEDLSRSLFKIPSFKFWIQDYSQGKRRRNRHTKRIAQILKSAPLQFNVEDPIQFFTRHGWKVTENIFILDEAERLGRSMPVMFPWTILMALFPKKIRKMANRTYGYVLLGKA